MNESVNPRVETSEWLGRIMGRYEGPLVRYASRITGDLERARDVVQDAFIRLLSASPGPDDDHVGEWLFTVCRNRSLDIRRKEKRMNALGEGQAEGCRSREPSPHESAEHKESASRLLVLLDELTENQQEVIRLRFQEGFSYKEIASITSLSIGNVGFLIHTGLKQLRAKFESPGSAVRTGSREQSP